MVLGSHGISSTTTDDPLDLGTEWTVDVYFKTPFPLDGFHTLITGVGVESEPVTLTPSFSEPPRNTINVAANKPASQSVI